MKEDEIRRMLQTSDYLTFEQHHLMGLLEQHAEYDGWLMIASESRTATAARYGIPAVLETGNFDKKGEPIILRVDKICNDYPWERFKKEFLPPTDRSFLSRAYTRLPPNYLTWLIKDYTDRYRNLSKKTLEQIYILSQLETIWQIHKEKVEKQRMGYQAFVSLWVYEQMQKCMELRGMHANEIIEINKRAKAHRNSRGRYGISGYEAMTRRIEIDAKYHMLATALWRERPNEALDTLPTGTPKLVLLQQWSGQKDE